MEITVVALFVILGIFPVQLILCFLVKPLWIRLVPAVFFGLASASCFFISLVSGLAEGDVAGVIYFCLGIFAALILLSCETAWAVWALTANLREKRRASRL